MVKDANGKTATGTFGITTVASSGYDGPAQLPLVTVATAMAIHRARRCHQRQRRR